MSGGPEARIALLARAARRREHGSGSAARVSDVTREMLSHLQANGAQVDIVVPEAETLDLSTVSPQYDLYLLKAKSTLSFALANALEARGARLVNTFGATHLTKDKIAATAVIAGVGVPVPRSWATVDPARLRPFLSHGPLWIKPRRGSMGEGIRRVITPEDLAECRLKPGEALLAQQEVPSEGDDLKVYVAGEQVWAITRPYPARTEQEKHGQPATVTPEVRDAALRCGRALGLELYGVDFLRHHDRFWAVDVNAFPSYKGIPEAPSALADYVWREVHR
jgi:ribosomal protein S6--L-glutamate ligase